MLVLLLTASLSAQSLDPQRPRAERVEESGCHVFIDYKSIWTMEVVKEMGKAPVPVMNLVTFDAKESPLRPQQIHLYNKVGQTPEVTRLAIDTGVPGDPYITNFLNVQANSFIAFDLVGDFEGFEKPDRVTVELEETEYNLQAIDCLDFEMLVGQINKVNFDSPDVKQDYDLLGIRHMGKRKPRRTGRR